MAAPDHQRAPPALAAFLRGVERRAAVLAELQCGDAAAGDAALAAAMGGFRQSAGHTVMDDWPRRFWALLIAQPALRSRTPVAIAVDATDCLGEMGSGPRAALLLRLAAGLDEAGAAAVLGVRTRTYRLALQRGLPHQPDGRADPRAWSALREHIHRRIKTLPAPRLDRLARAREAVLRGDAVGTPAMPAGDSAATVPARPAWLMPVLWALLTVCVLAMVATFLPPWQQWTGGAGSVDPRTDALPEQAPASRYGAEAAAVLHRDFELLADPQGVAMAADFPFHAWLAAGADARPAEVPPLPLTTADTLGAEALETTATEHADEIE
ncbi:MAG: hypothetical protein ABIR20_00945 [Lysobacter sp.]